MEKLFNKKSILSNEAHGLKYNHENHMKELKSENGKKKAIEKYMMEVEKLNERREAISKTAPMMGCTISVDWVRSSTWGHNPHADLYIWNGERSERTEASASGCGYDKLSGAVASALNDSELITATLYANCRKLNKAIKNGSGFYGIGRDSFMFNGGTGVECYARVFEAIGYKWEHHETDRSDFISITKKGR